MYGLLNPKCGKYFKLIVCSSFCISKFTASTEISASTETLAFFGDDPLPYGLPETNRKVVGKLIGYLHEQKLISRAPAIDELFVEGSADYREHTDG